MPCGTFFRIQQATGNRGSGEFFHCVKGFDVFEDAQFSIFDIFKLFEFGPYMFE